MTFDANAALEELKTTLRNFGHPRADAQAARAALEGALGSAQLSLANFKPGEHREPRHLYGQLVAHIELAKSQLRPASTDRR